MLLRVNPPLVTQARTHQKEAEMPTVVHKSKIIAVGIAAAMMIAMLGALATQSATATTTPTVNWQIAMKPAKAHPRTTGTAQYQSQPGQRELQIEREHLRALAGKKVTFYANGSKFGTAKVSKRGIVQIDRNTERGQSVPHVVHGSTVTARTGTGALVSRGRF
jgi:predicted PilT family ATPase